MVTKVSTDSTDDVVTAEAVAWITRLHGAGRSAAEEAAFREWLQADATHARAFSRATDVWELIPGAARAASPGARAEAPGRRFADFKWPAVGIAAAACVALIAVFVLRTPTYSTAVGQQQVLVLEDGSRLYLNTDTRIAVDYSDSERRVLLQRGEALFDVAADALRPFFVEAGEKRIRALGTRFVVHRESGNVSVTLIDGKVAVARASAPREHSAQAVILKPGERLTTQDLGSAAGRLDRPKPETVAAWRRGEVMFDDVMLQEAADELGRYGGPALVMKEADVGRLRVSGVFSTSDPEEFARAMAQMHQLKLSRDGAEIVLSR